MGSVASLDYDIAADVVDSTRCCCEKVQLSCHVGETLECRKPTDRNSVVVVVVD